MLSWALLLPYYLICVVNSLLLAVPNAPLCFWQVVNANPNHNPHPNPNPNPNQPQP